MLIVYSERSIFMMQKLYLALSFFSLFICHSNTFASNIVVVRNGTSIKDQMTTANTYYEIDDDIDLKGKKLSVPVNSTLDFRGGSIRNGEIVFNCTYVKNPSFKKMHFSGSTREEYFDIVDYGAESGVKTVDCAVLINEIIALKRCDRSERNAKTIHIPNGTFYIKSPILLWAGWEAPITLEGNGNTSSICQLTDNEYLIKVYECHNVKNLRLTYNKRQNLIQNRSIAVACQRAIFCLFENLTICKAHTAFGYITKADYKGDGLTNLNEQCYVSCNFRNIRIYEFSSYAFDFRKERLGGDSGSVYDNIYINCYDWLANTRDNVSRGAINGNNTIAVFTQLNIEGANYSEPLIVLNGMSRVNITSLHVEGPQNVPPLMKIEDQSVIQTSILDLQSCLFKEKDYTMFLLTENGIIDVGQLMVRDDCKKDKEVQTLSLYKSLHGLRGKIEIKRTFDAIKLLK